MFSPEGPLLFIFSPEGGLIDLPVRVTFSPALPSDCFAIDFPGRAISPGEGSPRPLVARAQEIIRLHPSHLWHQQLMVYGAGALLFPLLGQASR
jgi:hypothetical protein